jgi:sugar O-acyltransferase (sialic acid O-acetyltransferase NeuD family)
MQKLLLVGAGGHCRSVIDSIDRKQYSDIVIIDMPEVVEDNILSLPIVGTDDDILSLFNKGYRCAVITVGSIGNPIKRIYLYNKLRKAGYQFPSIIDPTAIISQSETSVAEGVFIGKGVIINAGVHVGAFSIINTGAIIDHDCDIGQFVHIGPGVRMAGEICIGDNVHIGIGSTLVQSISIGANSVIGAGSVVVSDIAKNVTAYGIPCKVAVVSSMRVDPVNDDVI